MADAKIYKVSLQRKLKEGFDSDKVFTVAIYNYSYDEFKELVNKFEARGWCPNSKYGLVKTAHTFDVSHMPGSPINILGALHLKGYTNAYHETDLFEYANDKIVNGKSIVIDNEDAFIVFTQLVWSFMQADFVRFTPSDLLQKAADAYNNSNSQYRRMEWFM